MFGINETIATAGSAVTQLSRVAALGLALLFAAPSGAVQAEPFGPEKRGEIEQIVKEYLLKNPSILRDAFMELERREQEQQLVQMRSQIGKNAEAMFQSKLTYVAGNPDGDVTLVEFFDYNCGFCKRSMDSVIKLIESDPKIRVVMREFPILGDGSLIASRAALASRKQNKYWDFHVALMKARGLRGQAEVMRVAQKVGLNVDQLKADMNDPSVLASIKESYDLAKALGIQGTPTFVLDDQIIPNSEDIHSVLTTATAQIRANGGCRVC